LELFARFKRNGWHQWGKEDVEGNLQNNIAKRVGHVGREDEVDLSDYGG
jgi:hypothetical protein